KFFYIHTKKKKMYTHGLKKTLEKNMQLNINETFGSHANMLEFYKDLNQIAEMARNPYANLLLSSVISLTISFVQKHKKALDKLHEFSLGNNIDDQNRKPEQTRSLEKTTDIQKEDK